MTVVLVDDVAGRKSSMCRRGEHLSCQTAKARCGCPCHGAQGQTPPTTRAPVRPSPPTEEKEAPVAEPSGTKRRSPTPDPGGYRCQDCGGEFLTPAGLGGHRKVHNKDRANGRTPPPRPKPAKPSPKAIAAPLDGPDLEALADVGSVVLVRHDDRVEVVELQTRVDADRVVALLAGLGIDAALYVKVV